MLHPELISPFSGWPLLSMTHERLRPKSSPIQEHTLPSLLFSRHRIPTYTHTSPQISYLKNARKPLPPTPRTRVHSRLCADRWALPVELIKLFIVLIALIRLGLRARVFRIWFERKESVCGAPEGAAEKEPYLYAEWTHLFFGRTSKLTNDSEKRGISFERGCLYLRRTWNLARENNLIYESDNNRLPETRITITAHSKEQPLHCIQIKMKIYEKKKRRALKRDAQANGISLMTRILPRTRT